MSQDVTADITEAAIEARLRSVGVTPTRQRMAIARVMFARAQHLSAEQLVAELRRRGDEHVSKATVYNTLGLFAEMGLVRPVIADPERVFYDSNLSEHHHLYDVDSGTLTDIEPGSVAVGPVQGLDRELEVTGVDVVVRVRRAR